MVRYEVGVETLLARVPPSDRAAVGPVWQVDEAAALDQPSHVVAVPGIEGLRVRVTPRLPGELRLTALRIVLWLSALVGVLGLIALRRALEREAHAMARERSFLAGVTHELRTPVTAIRVLGETLADGRGDPREYGNLVAQEGERLEALVERVLTLNRIDASLKREDVNPAELLGSAVALMRHRAERRGVEIECKDSDHLPGCCWDPDAVRRALLNLLENAVVHGREGGRVEASASVAGNEIRLCIADDGPGIGGSDRPRVFGRFERGGTDAPGTGLGLFLVDQVARAHGGRVHLETTMGHGSTFTLMLPIRPPGSPKEQSA
jgi:signal transduction histidine kinase